MLLLVDVQVLWVWSIQEARNVFPRSPRGAVLFIILFRVAGPKTAKKRLGIIATVGLGVGGFVYGIIALFVPVV